MQKRAMAVLVVVVGMLTGACEANIRHVKSCKPIVEHVETCEHAIMYRTQVYEPGK